MAALLSSCNDFQEINEDPNLVGEDKVKPQWFLNASIMGDQMNPEIAERIFILYWDRASRFNRGSGFTIGTDNNDYSTIYLSNEPSDQSDPVRRADGCQWRGGYLSLL